MIGVRGKKLIRETPVETESGTWHFLSSLTVLLGTETRKREAFDTQGTLTGFIIQRIQDIPIKTNMRTKLG